MKYRTLGRTGLRVSEVGFGCGNIGGMMIRGSHDEQVATVRHALGLGLNYFDTAPSYGDGLSETHLGQVLGELRPAVHVGTKFSLQPQDRGDMAGAVRRSLEASLRRLGMDSVDLLQLHNPIGSTADGRRLAVQDVLAPGGVSDALDALRSEGLIRFAGMTGLGETPALHVVVASGRFDTVQAYFNMLNPSAAYAVPSGFATQDYGRIIVSAAAQGMGVLAIRVMAGGALGGPGARSGYAAPSVGGELSQGHSYDADTLRVADLARVVAGSTSLARAAVRFALDCAEVSTAMVGFSTSSQVDEAAGASEDSPLSEGLRQALRGLWAE